MRDPGPAKNNRNPTTAYDEAAVAEAVENLRAKNLAYVFYGSNSRVPSNMWCRAPPIMQAFLICLLMLRGPQTVGELHGRAGRMFDFKGLEEVEETINSLITKDPDPMVVRLPRQPGQKEARFAHLLAGEIDPESFTESQPGKEAGGGRTGSSERIAQLEQEVERLSAELQSLQRQFEEFKKQFE